VSPVRPQRENACGFLFRFNPDVGLGRDIAVEARLCSLFSKLRTSMNDVGKPLYLCETRSERIRTAQVVPDPSSIDTVVFGSTVTFNRKDEVESFTLSPHRQDSTAGLKGIVAGDKFVRLGIVGSDTPATHDGFREKSDAILSKVCRAGGGYLFDCAGTCRGSRSRSASANRSSALEMAGSAEQRRCRNCRDYIYPATVQIDAFGRTLGVNPEFVKGLHKKGITLAMPIDSVQTLKGGQAAVAYGTFTSKYTDPNTPPGQGNWAQVFERDGQGWKIVAHASSRAASSRAALAPNK
jgi:hypothetical protein